MAAMSCHVVFWTLVSSANGGVDYSAYFLAFFPIQNLRQGQPSPGTSGQVEQHVSQPTSTLQKRKCIHETQLAQKGAFCSVLLDIGLRWADYEGFKFPKVGDGSCTWFCQEVSGISATQMGG